MQQLSPRKYIETRVRSLPIYRCIVNEDWEATKMAHVVVMRRHSNGNVSAGYYLVDLRCLGVKDSLFYFNLDERDIEDDLLAEGEFIAIDYQLAHNIIFAGHDFAMEYGIEPHKEFAVTRFILEDDNDTIPLIDIDTGDKGGIPHLVINPFGEGRWALRLLQQHAGPGNFLYTDPDRGIHLNDGTGSATASSVEQYISWLSIAEVAGMSAEDLKTEAASNKRQLHEKLNVNIEQIIREWRLFMEHQAAPKEPVKESVGYALLAKTYDFINGPSGKLNMEAQFGSSEADDAVQALSLANEADFPALAKQVFEKFPHNVRVLVYCYQIGITENERWLTKNAVAHLQPLAKDYPLAAIILCADCLLFDEATDVHLQSIIDAADIHKAFPAIEQFGITELYTFWLVRLLAACKRGDAGAALVYYKLIGATDLEDAVLRKAQFTLSEFLLVQLNAHISEAQSPISKKR